MHFDLAQRRAWLSAGEVADFLVGPRDSGAGGAGLWRAQLGSQWHRELRDRAGAEGSGAEFEVAVEGEIAHRGWQLVLSGRIDQLIRAPEGLIAREIKTVTRSLPAGEAALRADYPSYFVQLAAYVELLRREPTPVRAELTFVEIATGVVQTVGLVPADGDLLRGQFDRVAEFLELRLRATERLRRLRFRPPFATLRPGQDDALEALQSGFGPASAPDRGSVRMLLEAPTGFGKTGVMLEFALGELRAGRFDRTLYLTSKATGQLQVMQTLAAMTAPAAGEAGGRVAAWQVRAKSEHCVNPVFHCVREICPYLEDVTARWPQSGLARFYLFEDEPRDLATLRAAGRGAAICPYEITRAALAFNDVWIGDYNYVFAPANRSLFYQQPGFDPSRTLLIVDEAHNLPSRAADAYSHVFVADEAAAAGTALRRVRAPAPFLIAWEEWTDFLTGLEAAPAVGKDNEATARRLIGRLAEETAALPLDRASLGPGVSNLVGQFPAIATELESADLPRLWWCPRPGELRSTCLDAGAAIGAALREFGGVVLASATPGPPDAFAEACGVAGPDGLAIHAATAPWRDDAYDVACDLRVDTSFRHRERHRATTASAVEALHQAARQTTQPALAVFFSSYAYAESIIRALAEAGSDLRAAMQPRLPDLAAQAAWVETSLASADALFLVLGSSFAESIDLLGGRVSHAMVVGPALPEVNAVQRARQAAWAGLGATEAFRRVYRIPGMQKVNQSLGRLVRAPGHRAKVLLHCRRFAEPGYAELLAPEYRNGIVIRNAGELAAWLGRDASSTA